MTEGGVERKRPCLLSHRMGYSVYATSKNFSGIWTDLVHDVIK